MADDVDLTDSSSIDATDPIVRRAHKRFRKCEEWESQARQNWAEDYKFAHGDAYNNYQWPADVYQDRGSRPSLTVNETRQHNLHVINEARQNKTEVKYRPTGGGSTEAAAEVYEGLYRHIANHSNAQMAQIQAVGFQVQAGLGWTVIEADYIAPAPKPGPDAFNQEIYIRGVENPMNVYLDCDCTELDGTGARYGFIFADRPKDEVEEEYPELKGKLAIANAVDGEDAGWIREDHVREARYYEVTEDRDELLGDDVGTTTYASQVPRELIKLWEEQHKAAGSILKRRPVIRKEVKCHLIIGNDVVKTTDIPGTAVPIVPWVGEVTVIDRQMDRKGHTRAMISAQQMINYNWSAAVEYGALQSKSPWVLPVAATEGVEPYWGTANETNHSYLPWKHRDDEGNDIPPPQKAQPPASSPVYLEGVQMARQFMMVSSGQYEAELGEQGNEKSGKAINERQRQGDRATYHFIDNQGLAIRRQGAIIKDWIPVIYDTQRVAKIIDVAGEEGEVMIDPDSPEAHHERRIQSAVQRIFNPNVGTYAVVSDIGPDYATRRQEAFNAIIQILTQAPQLIPIIGDLLFKSADFPQAEEIAERLKPGMDPEHAKKLIGDLQTQLQKLTKVQGETMQALAEERLKVRNDNNDQIIKAFDADTKRMAVFKDALQLDPQGASAAVHETIRQLLQDNLGPAVAHLMTSLQAPANDAGGGGPAQGFEPVKAPAIQTGLAT